MNRQPRGLLGLFTVLMLAGVAALVLSVQNAVNINNEADTRNRERITSDLRACERGNVLRRQLIKQAEANDELVSTILDTVFRPDDPRPNVVAIRSGLQAPLDRYRKSVAGISLVDCKAVTPGA